MYNLSTVITFEVIRTLKKKSFWIMALGFPLMMVALFGIIFLSNRATNDAMQKMSEEKFSIAMTDKSHLVDPAMATALNVKTTSKDQGVTDVKNGKINAYYYYPADLAKDSVEIYAANTGLFDNGKYEAVAKALLKNSVSTTVSPNVQSVIADKTRFASTYYKDGAVYDSFKEMIVPGMFLVLFYLVISFFGGQMLNSTVEEKENRVIEMILTTIEARTLIIGKILSLVALGLLQAFLVIIPAVVGYFLLHDKLNMPTINFSDLGYDWTRIILGAAIFVVSFLLFTGLLVAIGAAVPTAKEAGGFMGLVMMLIFGPLYAASLFVSAPENPFVQFLSYFPFTAPIPLLLRNAAGTLPLHEGLIALTILIVCSILVLRVAVRVFQYGALEYSRKLSLREIFGKN